MPREGKARVLSETEFKRVIKVAGADRHAARNVALLYVSFGLGLRVKEIGALSVADVLDGEGQLRAEVNLQRRMTKGHKQRHAYLSNPKVRQALQNYLEKRQQDSKRVFGPGSALFLSNKGSRFTPNSLPIPCSRCSPSSISRRASRGPVPIQGEGPLPPG